MPLVRCLLCAYFDAWNVMCVVGRSICVVGCRGVGCSLFVACCLLCVVNVCLVCVVAVARCLLCGVRCM